MMNMGALISNEHGYSGMQGRGFFAGVSGYGFHAEYSQNGGFDWGGSTKLAEYYLENNESKDKWVGVNVMGFQVARYDHDARNENAIQVDVMGKDYDEFKKIADENGMEIGEYENREKIFHEPHPFQFAISTFWGWFTNSPVESSVKKYWMSKENRSWWEIPSVEGLFDNNGHYYSAPSYNYGNNKISHTFYDVIPYLVFDRLGL